MKRILLSALFMLLSSNTYANLINNGSFETGNFSGWTQSGNVGFTGVVAGGQSGSFSASFGPVGSVGSISQTIATTIGLVYDLSYWLANDGGTPNSFSVNANAASLISLLNAPAFGYQLYTQTFTAAAASTTISFNFQQNPAWWHLDNISLTSTNVPAPATLALLGLGLAGLSFSRRRNS